MRIYISATALGVAGVQGALARIPLDWLVLVLIWIAFNGPSSNLASSQSSKLATRQDPRGSLL